MVGDNEVEDQGWTRDICPRFVSRMLCPVMLVCVSVIIHLGVTAGVVGTLSVLKSMPMGQYCTTSLGRVHLSTSYYYLSLQSFPPIDQLSEQF